MSGRPKKVKETEYYEVLGVATDAHVTEIRRSYKKMAMKYHPDRNPNNAEAHEKFVLIGEAYEVLTDDEKRVQYDRYGKEALKEGGRGGNPNDIFSHFFGGMFPGGGGGQRQRKTDDVGVKYEVSLEDLYKGKTTQLSVKRNILCPKCEGAGVREGATMGKCRSCAGRGAKISLQPIGPGMVQQVQVTCQDCRGSGNFVRDQDRCKGCSGARTTSEKKALKVYIEKGMKDGQKIVFAGEADEEPDLEAGDVILILQEKPHPVFKRMGNDLFMEKSLTLSEALTGGKFVFNHLDDRQVVVTIPRGEILHPGEERIIEGEGMPTYRNHQEKGNLHIKITIAFPPSLTEEQMTILEKNLPPRPPLPQIKEDDTTEHVTLTKMTPSQEQARNMKGGRREAYEEDDEEEEGGHRGPGVQCAQQ